MELLRYFCVILHIYINIRVFVLNLWNVILAIPLCTYKQQQKSKILYNICLKDFSFSEDFSQILLQVYIDLHVKYPPFLTDIDQTWVCR